MRKSILTLLIVVSAASAYAQKVQVGADPAVDVSKYRTYAWDPKSSTPNPMVHQIVVDAVDRAMATKGLTKVETNPELTIVLVTATETALNIAYPTWSSAMGSAVSTGIAVGSQAWPVTKGTLVVDISDARTKNNVWRGTATDTLKHGPTGNKAKDAKDAEKQIRKAVEKMFKQFPHPARR